MNKINESRKKTVTIKTMQIWCRLPLTVTDAITTDLSRRNVTDFDVLIIVVDVERYRRMHNDNRKKENIKEYGEI